jgi:hypothetical protein
MANTEKEVAKVAFGNLDKENKYPLPAGKAFNLEDDYYIHSWAEQLMDNGKYAKLEGTDELQVYPSNEFNKYFAGHEKGAKTQFETVTGRKYVVLNDPTI